MTSDAEIAQLVCGTDANLLEIFEPSLEICTREEIFTQRQALEWLGARYKPSSITRSALRRPAWEEAREALSTVVLAHISSDGPTVELKDRGEICSVLNLRPKAVYAAVMVRRVLQAVREGSFVDDRDFVGNKRLELCVFGFLDIQFMARPFWQYVIATHSFHEFLHLYFLSMLTTLLNSYLCTLHPHVFFNPRTLTIINNHPTHQSLTTTQFP